MTPAEFKAEAARTKARQLRYKRPALASLGGEYMMQRLQDIQEEIGDVTYFLDGDDGRGLLDALDGDEEEAFEFQMMFSKLQADAERLLDTVYEYDFDLDEYDMVTTAILGEHGHLVGYDDYEEDYFALTNAWEEDAAITDAGKHLMAKTKKDMVQCLRKNWGLFLAFFDLDQEYEHLEATMNIIRGGNQALLQAVRQVENLYERLYNTDTGRMDREVSGWLDKVFQALPERMWLE